MAGGEDDDGEDVEAMMIQILVLLFMFLVPFQHNEHDDHWVTAMDVNNYIGRNGLSNGTDSEGCTYMFHGLGGWSGDIASDAYDIEAKCKSDKKPRKFRFSSFWGYSGSSVSVSEWNESCDTLGMATLGGNYWEIKGGFRVGDHCEYGTRYYRGGFGQTPVEVSKQAYERGTCKRTEIIEGNRVRYEDAPYPECQRPQGDETRPVETDDSENDQEKR